MFRQVSPRPRVWTIAFTFAVFEVASNRASVLGWLYYCAQIPGNSRLVDAPVDDGLLVGARPDVFLRGAPLHEAAAASDPSLSLALPEISRRLHHVRMKLLAACSRSGSTSLAPHLLLHYIICAYRWRKEAARKAGLALGRVAGVARRFAAQSRSGSRCSCCSKRKAFP